MGIVFDKPGLLSNLTIYENLKLRFLALKKGGALGDVNDDLIDELIIKELTFLGLENKKLSALSSFSR